MEKPRITPLGAHHILSHKNQFLALDLIRKKHGRFITNARASEWD